MASGVVKCLAAVAMVFGAMAMTGGSAAAAPPVEPIGGICGLCGPCFFLEIGLAPDAVLPGATLTVTLSEPPPPDSPTTNILGPFVVVLDSHPVTLGTMNEGSAVFRVPLGTTPGDHVVTAGLR